MTSIRVDVRNSELGVQLRLRLREPTRVVWNSDSLAVQIETDDHRLLAALSELRDALASLDEVTARVEIDGQSYILDAS
jgi:hypothetical protein